MVKLALALAVLASCSYRAAFEDCRVACDSPDECPSGFECGDEGLCRPTGGGQSCASVLGDAGNPIGDGGAARCFGTPAPCAMFIPMSDCLGHGGCTYSTSTCTRIVDCSAITTNQQCTSTPGCQTDISTSTCEDIPGYCHGLDEDACESLHVGECTFAGGCAGTPSSCESYTDRSECVTTDGCDFED